MMHSPDKIINTLRSIRMTSEEKSRIKMALIERIGSAQSAGLLSGVVWYMRRYSIATALATFLLMAGALVGISESSVPGDATYSIKRDVTEPLGDAIAVSEEQQMSWDVTKAERRLAEAEQLASEGGF